jgi:hypothetical protein
MQAVGMVNDHVVGCFRHEELKNKGEHNQMGHRMGSAGSQLINRSPALPAIPKDY